MSVHAAKILASNTHEKHFDSSSQVNSLVMDSVVVPITCELAKSRDDCRKYLDLTIPSLTYMLEECPIANINAEVKPGEVIAIGCHVKSKNSPPVGLLIAIIQETRISQLTQKSGRHLLITSIQVIKQFQGLGLARAMQKRCLEIAQKIKASSVSIDIPVNEMISDVLRAITPSSSGWKVEPGPILATMPTQNYLGIQRMLHQAVMRGKLVEKLKTTSLLDLINAGVQDSLKHLNTEELPPWAKINRSVSDLDDIDEHASLCLWSDRTLIGWILCEWIDPKRLRVSSLWLNMTTRISFPGAVLLYDALSTCKLSRRRSRRNPEGLPPELITFGFNRQNNKMARLAENKLKGFCQHWVEMEKRTICLIE